MPLNMHNLRQRYTALARRERILFVSACAAVMFTVWAQLAYGPMQARYALRHNEVATMSTGITTLRAQLKLMSAQLSQDPNQEIKLRLARTQQEIARLDLELKEKLHGLIAPQQMPGVLEAMLKQNTNLQLTRVQALGAKPLLTKENAKESSENGVNTVTQVEVYQHGVEIEFTGSYLATLDYLNALQSLPWEFYWDAVRLDVEKHPLARVVITVHTLSLKQGWIGV